MSLRGWTVAPWKGVGIEGDEGLYEILRREAVDAGVDSPVRGVQAVLRPLLTRWAGGSLLDIFPSCFDLIECVFQNKDGKLASLRDVGKLAS